MPLLLSEADALLLTRDRKARHDLVVGSDNDISTHLVLGRKPKVSIRFIYFLFTQNYGAGEAKPLVTIHSVVLLAPPSASFDYCLTNIKDIITLMKLPSLA